LDGRVIVEKVFEMIEKNQQMSNWQSLAQSA